MINYVPISNKINCIDQVEYRSVLQFIFIESSSRNLFRNIKTLFLASLFILMRWNYYCTCMCILYYVIVLFAFE